MNSTENFITENMYESAWLIANDIKLSNTFVKDNGFVIFEFENKEKCRELILEYYSNKKISKIPVKDFVNAIRLIKNIIRELKEKK